MCQTWGTIASAPPATSFEIAIAYGVCTSSKHQEIAMEASRPKELKSGGLRQLAPRRSRRRDSCPWQLQGGGPSPVCHPPFPPPRGSRAPLARSPLPPHHSPFRALDPP